MTAPAASGGGPDDLIFQALIDDRTKTFFDQFDQRIAQLDSNTQHGFDNVSKSIDNSGAKMGMIAGVVGSLTGKVIEFGLQGVAAMKQFIEASTMARARADTLSLTMDIVGRNTGNSTDQLDEYEAALRKTGITIMAARQALTQMMQSNLDLTKASQLAREAQDAAVIAGTNSSEAFTRILHAVTTLQPEILRSLGLIVNADQAYEKYAVTINKTAAQLTVQEKQQAFMNATLAAGVRIAGSYEAAMTTVGKKLNSLPRYYEDISVALGAIGQPVLDVGVDALMSKLKEILKYLEENEEALTQFGERLATVFKFALDNLDRLLSILASTPGTIENWGMAIATYLAQALDVASPEEIEARRSKLGEYFAQGAALMLAFIQTAASTVVELGKMAVDFWVAVGGVIAKVAMSAIVLFRGDVAGSQALMDEAIADAANAMGNLSSRMRGLGSNMAEEFGKAVVAAGEFTGALDRADGKAGEIDLGKPVEDLQKLVDALNQANRALDAFYDKIQEDVEARAIAEARRAMEAALRESWYQEDRARQHAEAVRNIEDDANEARAEAAQRYAETRIDIERDYQRRIRDMQRKYEWDASELARARDDVGLLRLMRQHDQQVVSETQARDDRLEDARIAYQRERERIAEQRAEALEDLEEQYRREEEAHQRSLERDRQLQALHDQWAEEDRQKAYAKELADLLEQLGSIEGMTDESLKNLLDAWGVYFGDLIALAETNMEELGQVLDPLGLGGQSSGSSGSGGSVSGSGAGGNQAHPVQAQGGQVSQALANPIMSTSMTGGGSVPYVPQVNAKGSSDYRRLDVNITGDNIEPYIQRVLAAMLMEVERNRG